MTQTWTFLKSVLNKNDERVEPGGVELLRYFCDGNNIIEDKGEIDHFNNILLK